MTPTTLVMAYYDNWKMLLVQYGQIAKMPARLRDLLHVVIVDDGSPNKPALPRDIGCSLQVYRLDVDVRWNQDAARNIGVAHAETNWVLLTDMDHMITPEIWKMVLLREWDPTIAYQFERVSAPEMLPYKFHPNTWFMTKKKFEEAGGYDERFAGYYGTDADFRNRIEGTGEVKRFKQAIIRVPRTHIADASTTTYLRKQPEDLENIRRIDRKSVV